MHQINIYITEWKENKTIHLFNKLLKCFEWYVFLRLLKYCESFQLFCCSSFSLIRPEKYLGKRRGACASEISPADSENQVKTYMDSSNGVRNASSNAYNKVRTLAKYARMKKKIILFIFIFHNFFLFYFHKLTKVSNLDFNR